MKQVIISYSLVDKYREIAVCYADSSKAKKELWLIAKRSILDMCRDAWKFDENYQSEVE